MSTLAIFLWNLKGLNNANKRASCLEILTRNQIDIVMLQETHLLERYIYRLENPCHKVVAFSSAPNKTKGVAMIINKKLDFFFFILDKGSDQGGRITFLKCLYNCVKIALVSVYAPNGYEPNFFDSLTNTLY